MKTTRTNMAIALVKAAAAAGALSMCAAACGGSKPPPKPVEEPKQESTGPSGPQLVVEQEFGSIDPGAVEQTFSKLEGDLERCHVEGRDRLEYLAGDVKVFLRIDKQGKVRWGYFEESTLGDRDTEKCIMDVLSRATWPRPIGGEAEVRHGFGWSPGGERQPTPWGPEKVMGAIDDSKEVKSSLAKCRAGVTGQFQVTVYVTHDDSPPPASKKGKPKKRPSKADKEKTGGKLEAIGVAPPSKEGADKVDCIVEALKELRVPSPGSYAAKTTFPL
jgi:hypothetical protein